MNDNAMRALVNIEQQNIALLFANYLRSLGIAAEVLPGATQGFDLYCACSQFERARDEFEQFIRQPYAQKYQQAAWQNADTNVQLQASQSLLAQFHQQFRAHAGPLTLVVFALCWLVFLASYFGFAAEIFAKLHFFTRWTTPALLHEPWRLLTPALFHFSWLHIVFNTLWWWQLGGEIENKLGSQNLLMLLLLSALVSNFGQFMVSGANFGGLSGVVYGLVGFMWWLGWLAPRLGVTLARPLVMVLLLWMALGFIKVLPVNMANTAHALGLVSGCALAALVALFYRNSPRSQT